MQQVEPRPMDIVSTRGLTLTGWHQAHESARGVVVIAHGLGEHAGCYRDFAHELARKVPIDVVGFDFRGHGQSPGPRGFVRHYDDLLDDLAVTLAWVKHERTDLPLFVLGHSNGGLVALRTVLERSEHAIDGLIVSNPVLKLANPAAWWERLAAHVLVRVAPRVTLEAPISPEKMTRDPAMQTQRLADPLRHRRISAPMYFGMDRGGPLVLAKAGLVTIPTLVILGGSDPVVNPQVGRDFYDRLGSTDKALALFPEMRHEPINELGRDHVVDAIAGWLKSRSF